MPVPAQDQAQSGVSVPPNTPIHIGAIGATGSLDATEGATASNAPGLPEMAAEQIANSLDMAVQQLENSAPEAEATVSGSSPNEPTPDLGQSAGTSPIAGESVTAAPQPMLTPVQQQPIQLPETPMVNKGYITLADALVGEGYIAQDLGNKLQVDQITSGKTIETLVTESNIVTEEQLAKAKSAFNNVPFIKLSEVGVFPEAINQLPEGAARHYAMLPFTFDKSAGTLSVAMKDPLDLTAIDFAQQKTGFRIIAYYAMPSELDRMIAEYYSQTLSSEVTAALEQTTQMADAREKLKNLSSLSRETETIRQAPITKIVETLLTFAMKARASDIHIEPLEDRTRVRYRIDGILAEKLILPKSVHEAVVSRIKILSGLKIDEKRLPQDGRFNFSITDQEVDLRVSTLPTIHGEKIVMRLLKKDTQVPTLPELGLTGLSLHNVEASIKVPHGIILITGPTGSGKTTTLYSILHDVNTPRVNIMTLEDPVEYQMPGVNQVQINPQAGLTFASGLRSFLRQDPNIIMVGEIRDSETAELAIQASLTGHLVFSTLHTSSAAGALPRLMDMGAEPFLLASSMTLVMAQRVLRVINPKYKEEYTPEPAVTEDIVRVLGQERFDAWCKKNNKTLKTLTLWRGKKERPDNEPEFRGRVAIFEVMKITEEIAKLILERRPAPEMEKLALRDGMLFMKQDGYLKVLDGLTTIEEVLRVAQI